MKRQVLKRSSHKCGYDLCREKHQQKKFKGVNEGVHTKIFLTMTIHSISNSTVENMLFVFHYSNTSAHGLSGLHNPVCKFLKLFLKSCNFIPLKQKSIDY